MSRYGGISAGYLQGNFAKLNNLTYLTQLHTSLNRWGPTRLDFTGTPCNQYCDSECSLSRGSPFATTCLVSTACPPRGIAGYKVAVKLTLSEYNDPSEFTADKQAAMKTSVANYFSMKGAAVQAKDVTLKITAGSINVEATVQTPSALASQIIQDSVSTMNSTDATLYFNATVASAPTVSVKSQAGISGTINAPPNNNGATNVGGVPGAVVFIIVLLLLGCGAWLTYTWMQGNTTTPLMKAHQLQDTPGGVAMGNARYPPAVPPPTSGAVVAKEKHEMAEHI